MEQTVDLEEKIILLERDIKRLEVENSELEDELEDAKQEIDDLNWQLEKDIEDSIEIDDLKERDIYPRKEITLPELMKFEFLKENWDNITLEQLESLC